FSQKLPAALFSIPAFARHFELGASPENRSLRRGIESFRIEHGPLVMVAQEDHGTLHDQINTFTRIRTVADDVAQAINDFDLVLFNVGEDRLKRFEVAMDIADEGLHGMDLRGMKPCGPFPLPRGLFP